MTKVVRISAHVLERADNARPALASRLRLRDLSTTQLVDHLVTLALDSLGVPTVDEPPPDFGGCTCDGNGGEGGGEEDPDSAA